jgi:two-component system chemotaxis response regulator CheY
MSKTVLVIDDSDFVRGYHAQILASAGFSVLTAVDGSDGLEKLYGRGCDLVLTDINMARMDGYEFIRRVRAEARYDDLPIIIVSTESEQRDRMKGFEAGANLYLVKPSDPAVMIDNISIILASVAQPR